jgi:hypothetical protein
LTVGASVTTSVFPDDEGKAAARQLCAAWNVGLNRKVGGWEDDIILIEVYWQDGSRVAHLSPFSMTCK